MPPRPINQWGAKDVAIAELARGLIDSDRQLVQASAAAATAATTDIDARTLRVRLEFEPLVT